VSDEVEDGDAVAKNGSVREGGDGVVVEDSLKIFVVIDRSVGVGCVNDRGDCSEEGVSDDGKKIRSFDDANAEASEAVAESHSSKTARNMRGREN